MIRILLAAVAVAGFAVPALAVEPIPGPALTGTPERTFADPRITESSGLAVAVALPGVVYTHNDSDDDAVLYGVRPDGATVAWRLPGAPARDWEAMAAVPDGADGATLWIGDIGDNLSSWETVRLLRVAEPTRFADGELEWTRFDLRFPDRPRNAEALLADPRTGRLFVVSKEASDPGVFEVGEPTADAVTTLRRIADAPAGITDGAISATGRIVLVDYVYAWTAEQWAGPWIRQVLPFRPQGETVAWVDDDTVLVGSEGTGSQLIEVPLMGTPTPAATAEPSQPATPGNAEPTPAAGWLPWAIGGGVALLVAAGLLLRR